MFQKYFLILKWCAVWLMISTCIFEKQKVEGSNEGQQAQTCDVNVPCSQLCVRNADGFECSCEDGFKLKENDWGCDLIDTNWKLIYTTNGSSWVVSMENNEFSNTTKLTVPEGSHALGVTYDARNNAIYWISSNFTFKSVYRTNLENASTVEVVASKGIRYANNLAFDWIMGNIYFADTGYSRIFVCKNDSGSCAVIVKEFSNKPLHIALHPTLGVLFWTEEGDTSGIVRSGMDGSQPLKIISFDLRLQPTGLTVDQANARIYWAVEGNYPIESSRFDGRDRKVAIPGEIAGKPYGLNVLGDLLIWFDDTPTSPKILSADKFDGSNMKVIKENFGSDFINGLTVIHVANQPLPNHVSLCNCSHICTKGPSGNFKCFCPAVMQLGGDNKTCTVTDDTPKLVVAAKGTLHTMKIDSFEEVWETTYLGPKIKFISAIVYNLENHSIILSDEASKRIYEYRLRSKKLSVLVDGHLDRVESVDIDVVGENLYWADRGKNTIEAMSFRTRARVLIVHDMPNIQSILVVPETSSLYVSSYKRSESKIFKMSMTGGNESVALTSSSHRRPLILSYNRQLGNVLWLESRHTWTAYEGSETKYDIRSASANGSQSRVIWDIRGDRPWDFVNFGNLVYYNDVISLKVFHIGSSSSYPAPRIMLPNFDRNTTTYTRPYYTPSKMTIIDKNLYNLETKMTHHDCAIKNSNRKRCSHMCLLTGEQFVGVCRCPVGMILGADGRNCIHQSSCQPDQFTCRNRNCIPKMYVCDGKADCENQEDESNCQVIVCPQGHFKCAASGKCIPGDWVCDQEHDCVGGDDEFNCTRPCKADREFTCESTNHCIPKSLRCDGMVDCPQDYSDERDCEVTLCSKPHLLCRNGSCIEKELMCDGIPNCDDAEDEVNCSSSVVVPTGKQTPLLAPKNTEKGFVVGIVGLLTLIVITLPFGVFAVRWCIQSVFKADRPLVVLRSSGDTDPILDDGMECTSEQTDGECLETSSSQNSALGDPCPSINVLTSSCHIELKKVATAAITEDECDVMNGS